MKTWREHFPPWFIALCIGTVLAALIQTCMNVGDLQRDVAAIKAQLESEAR